jgi:hypothetical protein
MGAFIGSLGFGVAGALACHGPGGIYDPSSSECALGGAVLGVAGGALIGLAVGAFVRTERWEAVPLAGTGYARNGRRSTR